MPDQTTEYGDRIAFFPSLSHVLFSSLVSLPLLPAIFQLAKWQQSPRISRLRHNHRFSFESFGTPLAVRKKDTRASTGRHFKK